MDKVLANKKVLVVDDDPDTQELMLDILEGMECIAKIAKSGEEAVSRVSEEHFDLILMDMRLPGKSGIETIREIRIMEKDKGHIPIIALSGSSLSDPENTLSVGIEGWIMKPLHLDVLRSKMVEILTKDGDAHA